MPFITYSTPDDIVRNLDDARGRLLDMVAQLDVLRDAIRDESTTWTPGDWHGVGQNLNRVALDCTGDAGRVQSSILRAVVATSEVAAARLAAYADDERRA